MNICRIFITIFALTTRWILSQESSQLLTQFCLLLITASLVSWPIFSLLTDSFQEYGVLWSQLMFQTFGYGGVSLFFLSKTKDFNLSIFFKDLCLSCITYIPIPIVLHFTDHNKVNILISIITLVFIFLLKLKDFSIVINQLSSIDDAQ